MMSMIDEIKQRVKQSPNADSLYLLNEIQELNKQLESAIQSRDDYKRKWKRVKKRVEKLKEEVKDAASGDQ